MPNPPKGNEMSSTQLTRADLKSMTADEINEADAAGRLSSLRDGIDPPPAATTEAPAQKPTSFDGGVRSGSADGQLTRDSLRRMSPDQIERARVSGRLNGILGIR
jgi:hypothetical protein